MSQHTEIGILQFQTDLLGNHSAAGQDSDILQHFLAAVTEAGSLHADHVQRAAQSVDNQGAQRFAFHIFSDDDQLLAGFHGGFQQRENIRDH